jgi:membrane-associated phospholipid phosphatase
VCVSVWGRKALPILLLPIAVAFSTFYLGHHWVVDALAGATYAFASFSTVFLWFRRRQFAMGWLERATRRKTTTAIH